MRDVQTLRRRARGQWNLILSVLGGIDAQLLDGRHHACPKCGGKDRFRLLDAAEGACYCNQCFNRENGDGIAAVQWLTGMRFGQALDAVAAYLGTGAARAITHKRKPEACSAFDPEAAWAVYERAVRRGRDFLGLMQHPALKFLAGRGLAGCLAREPMHALCGIVDAQVEGRLPPAVRSWPKQGYQVVSGLWAVQDGDLQAVAARDVTGSQEKRVMCPRGARIAGSVFANPQARDLLRDPLDKDIPPGEQGPRVVLFGEGLTDMLALSLAFDGPVMTVSGVGQAPKCIGEWARGRAVLLCLDLDDASEPYVKPTAENIAKHGGKAVRLRWPPGCKDANDALVKLGIDAMRAKLMDLAGRASA